MLSTTAKLNQVSRYLNYFGAIPMIIFGTIGSILTIIVFTQQPSFRRNPTINYLLASAIMTAIHLPTIYSQSILVDGFLLGIFNTNDIACKEHNYLLYLTTVPAISFPCWAAFDQYACTCREATFRQRWHSMHFVRSAIIFTVVFCTLIYIPVISYSGVIDNRCVIFNVQFRQFLNYFLTPLLYTILPFFVIVFFSYKTMENLRLTGLVHRRDRLLKQIRRMLIPQLMILGISGFPFSFEVIYFEVTATEVKSELRQAVEHVFVQIFRLFYHCNFVCAFYIYVYMSTDVRKVLKQIFYKCLRKNIIVPFESSVGNSMTLQTMN